MQGLKSAILAIFHKWAIWLDWPCPVSAVLQKNQQDFFFLCYISILTYFLNMKPLSEVTPLLLVIQIQIQAYINIPKSNTVNKNYRVRVKKKIGLTFSS